MAGASMHIPRRHLLSLSALGIAMLLSTGSLGAQAAPLGGVADGGSAGPARMGLFHMTWQGFRGVRPGESLAAAARTLHGSVQVSCVFHYVAYQGPVYMDNGMKFRIRRVEEMLAKRRDVIGPRGIHIGMTARHVRQAMGPTRRHFTTAQGGHVLLLVGPGGVTEWAGLGGGKAYSLGLAPTFRTATSDSDIEGC
jgi:hypothetical protein